MKNITDEVTFESVQVCHADEGVYIGVGGTEGSGDRHRDIPSPPNKRHESHTIPL